MPFRDPTTTLILPPGISIPPPIGETAIVLDPGPPPSIKFYTGDADEDFPAEIRTFVSADQLGVQIRSAQQTPPGASIARLSVYQTTAAAAIDLLTEQFFIRDVGSFSTLLNRDTGEDFFRFQVPLMAADDLSGSNALIPVTDFDSGDRNTLTNTAYAIAGAGANPGLAFVAPPSGRGWIVIRVRAQINTTAAGHRNIWSAVRLGTGSTIGAGTAQSIEGIATPADDHSLVLDNCISNGTVEGNGTTAIYVTGLTAGNDFNLEMQHRLNNAVNANYDLLHRSLTWLPII